MLHSLCQSASDLPLQYHGRQVVALIKRLTEPLELCTFHNSKLRGGCTLVPL